MSAVSPWWLRVATRFANKARVADRRSHTWRVSAARRAIREIAGWEERDGIPIGARIIAYLRKVEPLVVEELALCAFENAGFAVWRNRAYSGDGGADGRVHLPGYGWCPLQVKRYARHIDLQHVRAFAEFVQQRGAQLGILFHTGRTGEDAWRASAAGRVLVVSGSAVARLIRDRRLSVPAATS